VGEGVLVKLGLTAGFGTSSSDGVHEARRNATVSALVIFMIFIDILFCKELPNGLRKSRAIFTGYWRWGGRGLCLGAEKTRSQKNA
jgi:hypothetical protein